MLGARATMFPMEQNRKLSNEFGKAIDNPLQYPRLVERLIYLTITHLDISYVVNILN